MIFSLSQLFLVVFVYLSLLFLVAYLTERNKIPAVLVNHPAVYVLSLGVYCSAWAYYGFTGLAAEYGLGYLAYFLGMSAAFALYPVFLKPMMRITRNYELGSLADVFAFRYRSPLAGTLTTLIMMIVILPLIALQITAITRATTLLSPDSSKELAGLVFCAIMISFTMLYGARQVAPRERHRSLIFAIAFESLLKLIIFLTIGAIAYFGVLGGEEGVHQWFLSNPEAVRDTRNHLPYVSWTVMLLMFLIAPLVMPHMFQVIFREARDNHHLKTASWAFPFYLLLMSLPVLPILWASQQLNTDLPLDYLTLSIGLGLDSPVLVILAYAGGLSAASGLIIVATLALASMTLNHVLVPFYRPRISHDIYLWLLWVRKYLIFCLIGAAYLFFLIIPDNANLNVLGIAAFVGTLQFLPGIIGTLFWSGATRKGFISGLLTGLIIWLLTLGASVFSDQVTRAGWLPADLLANEWLWTQSAIISLMLNMLVLTLVSIGSKATHDEKVAANACVQNSLVQKRKRQLEAKNTQEFIDSLSTALGKISAEREVRRALKELHMPSAEFRPYELRRIRDRIETNLSGMMGPSVAQSIVQRYLPYRKDDNLGEHEDINLIESQLEHYHSQLSGLAGELNHLRRYHRETLENLPMGVCSVGTDGEILMWNQSMEAITGIPHENCIGSYIDTLPLTWRDQLKSFMANHNDHVYKQEITLEDRTLWLNLHKANLPARYRRLAEGAVILVEDMSDMRHLERELLHSERLASIGSLAAGVAHEIGNPVTAIDCIAQDLMIEDTSPAVKEMADQIRGQTKRVTRIVRSLVNYAHAGRPDQEKSDHQNYSLAQIINEAIHLLELSKQSADVIFSNSVPAELLVPCDPQRLAQVFINLLNNSRDASSPGTHINVALYEPPTRDWVKIEVTDEGTGIEESTQGRIFEPFFTTKDVGSGTGLGLWVAYSIIEEHFGQITIESPRSELKDYGTRVIITLPKSQPQDSDGVIE